MKERADNICSESRQVPMPGTLKESDEDLRYKLEKKAEGKVPCKCSGISHSGLGQ